MWKYSDKVMDHYRNPRNVGSIKDADVMQHVLYNPLFDIKRQEQKRFDLLQKEFGIDE